MKYIRTKDGRIVKIGEQTDIGYKKGTLEVYNRVKYVASYEPFEVLKVADTIEELCDEFVMTHYFKETNYTHGQILTKENKDLFIKATILRKSDKDYNADEFNIMGAIWTEWGLKYVAKMNEKEELELL